jgi:eukaryotic-like serine/threonine-protein kinase
LTPWAQSGSATLKSSITLRVKRLPTRGRRCWRGQIPNCARKSTRRHSRLALSGDLPQSRVLAQDLAREFPEDTSVQFTYLATLRALFALSIHDAAAAIRALQTASRYDLALGSVGFIGRFGGLYPIYVRGVAHLAAHRPAEAAAEFQRILDHRSIVLVDPMDAMARLQLARALVLSGETAKAKSADNDLLALWKDADPQISIVNEARAEYARLQ